MPILRNARIAVIEQAKLSRYCLDPGHGDGRHKARVFKTALGFDITNVDDLIGAIRTRIMPNEAEYVGETAHSFLWRVDALIAGPRGIATEPVGSTRKARMSHGSRRRTSSEGDRREPPRRYRSLERVQLRQDLPEHGLARGDSGTVVHVFEAADACLVEFVDPADGSTRALAELSPDQLAPAGP